MKAENKRSQKIKKIKKIVRIECLKILVKDNTLRRIRRKSRDGQEKKVYYMNNLWKTIMIL